MQWDEFAGECPELAALGEQRLRGSELCLLGTLRRNGYPRISPVEPDFAAGELMLGMMWRSPKALDLLRDSRCAVHSVVSDRQGTEGDLKLYGGSTGAGRAELPPLRDRRRVGWVRDLRTGGLRARVGPDRRPAPLEGLVA